MTEETRQTQTTDNGELQAAVVRLFNSHFSEVLDIISSRFPHARGDGSANEAEFNGLRAKVLRSGNNKLRLLPEVLKDYRVTKVRETVEEKVVIVRTPVVMPGDEAAVQEQPAGQGDN